MDPGTLSLILVGIGVLAWILMRGDDARQARWWVAVTRRRPVGPVVLGIHAAALLALLGAWWLGDQLADAWGHPRWALVTVLPAVMAYGPFAIGPLPERDSSPYEGWREELRLAGADRDDAARIAWWGGPPAFVGFVLCTVSLCAVFLD